MPSSHDLDAPSYDRAALGFKRHLVLPGVLLTIAEIVGIAWPLLSLFSPEVSDASILLRVGIPVLIGAQLVWWAAMGAWMSPIYRAITLKRRGERLPRELALSAYRATWVVPYRALILRTALWIAIALGHGFFFMQYAGWEIARVAELGALAGLHAFATNLGRSLWYQLILARGRGRLFSGVPKLRQFADGYFVQLMHVSCIVSGGTVAAIAAFIYFFLPIRLSQYLELQLLFPAALALAIVVLYVVARRARRVIDDYLETQSTSGEDGAAGESMATAVYRVAQGLPYRLALTHIVSWTIAGAASMWVGRVGLRLDVDDAGLMFGTIVVIAIGSSLYQALWHRETVRPLLDHLTVRHRLPIRGIRASFSLRAKLLLYFGGMVFFAVGLALFWGFIQYKNLVTKSTASQADLGLAWLRSEVQGAVAARAEAPTSTVVRQVLSAINSRSPESSAVFYYIGNEPGAKVMAMGGGPMGAPVLPWYTRGQMQLSGDATIAAKGHSLTGRRGRLAVSWRGQRYDLGSLAVFYPSYRGRGPSIVRPLKELVLFFLVLFGACAGIVLFTVGQFVKPIRRLESRADGMARGELAKPVSSGGEGDEVGRLTFALEEMRRALREKLRSTEEVNLDLERAVQRRTADLAKKNRELAETLEKLTRAQDQLVRAEKMASIGQLVAGIAHEINNPVNAIVNTVGPLEVAIADIDDADAKVREEARDDVRDMVRVVQRGAQRTKAIVSALHNYSRTDDESLVEVDLNRSLDDSLELLRHLLKQSIRVERHYGEVGRIRGHAGQLNQVFMNLLTNAAQAVTGREGATVSVETRVTDDGKIAIVVRDNGEGIPSDVRPRIFDPFFTTKDVGEGSGLGLSIVHGIVERHGGSIEVDSEPGRGTAFTVIVPRGDETVLGPLD